MFTAAALALALLTSGGSIALTVALHLRSRQQVTRLMNQHKDIEARTVTDLFKTRDERIASLEADVYEKLDRLTKSTTQSGEALSTQLEDLKTSTDLMLEAGKAMEESVAALTARVDQAGETVKMETEAIAALKEQGSKSEEDIDTLSEQLGELEAVVNQLAATVPARWEVSDAFAELAQRELARSAQPWKPGPWKPGPLQTGGLQGDASAAGAGGSGMDLTSAEQAAQLNEALAAQLGDLKNRLQQLSVQQGLPS